MPRKHFWPKSLSRSRSIEREARYNAGVDAYSGAVTIYWIDNVGWVTQVDCL